MQRLILAIMIIALVCPMALGNDEFDYAEATPDISKVKIDTIRIRPYAKNVEISIRYSSADGRIIKQEKLYFTNREDNPETEDIDETITEYTDLMTGLGVNKTFLKNAIKFKLGIE